MNLKRSDIYRKLCLGLLYICMMLLISASSDGLATSGTTSYTRIVVQRSNSLVQDSIINIAMFVHAHTTSSSGEQSTPTPLATGTSSAPYTNSNSGTPSG